MIIKDLIEDIIIENKHRKKEEEFIFLKTKEKINKLADNFNKLRNWVNQIDNYNELKKIKEDEMGGGR